MFLFSIETAIPTESVDAGSAYATTFSSLQSAGGSTSPPHPSILPVIVCGASLLISCVILAALIYIIHRRLRCRRMRLTEEKERQLDAEIARQLHYIRTPYRDNPTAEARWVLTTYTPQTHRERVLLYTIEALNPGEGGVGEGAVAAGNGLGAGVQAVGPCSAAGPENVGAGSMRGPVAAPPMNHTFASMFPSSTRILHSPSNLLLPVSTFLLHFHHIAMQILGLPSQYPH